MLELVMGICERDFTFEDFEECRNYFKELINALRQMNYSEFKGERFYEYQEKLNNLLSNGK
jgi:V/A-type H+-transporting ATPase subunit A